MMIRVYPVKLLNTLEQWELELVFSIPSSVIMDGGAPSVEYRTYSLAVGIAKTNSNFHCRKLFNMRR